MADLFGETVEIQLPRRYHLNGRLSAAKISKIGYLENTEQLSLSPHPSRRIDALQGEAESGRTFVFTQRPTVSKMDGANVLVSPGAATAEEVGNQGTQGSINWLYPKPTLPSNLPVDEALALCDDVRATWLNSFKFREERRDPSGAVVQTGLRPPQIGALHAALAHWSVSRKPATVVMPTGTGKTETMLALLTAVSDIERLLVVVPNSALRDQIAEKFLTLGVLKTAGALDQSADLPVVATLDRRPKTADEVSEVFERSNVVVTTMQIAGQCNDDVQARMAELCTHLFIDEAHHIAARTWQAFRSQFDEKVVVQFTATPFRTDGKRVDGKFIYVYPLAKAQLEGYFRPITFRPVQGMDQPEADRAIIRNVGEQLRKDLASDHDHIAMARVNGIDRAIELHKQYADQLSEFSPVVIHSRMSNSDKAAAIGKLRDRESRIIVCVDMLGEGFDLPQLKIAGLHDRHKSIAVTLQFTGRFTRDSKNIGDATVFANIENTDAGDALRSLYAEDADWNFLLNILSETQTQRQIKRAEIMQGFRDSLEGVPLQTLNPRMSTVVYKTSCEEWRPDAVDEAYPATVIFAGPVVNEEHRLGIFITKDESHVKWSSTKEVVDVEWNLFMVHWDKATGLLYINSSKSGDLHEKLAKSLAGDDAARIIGEPVYRVLNGIKRLLLMNLGLSSTVGHYIRYTMFVGSDVVAQLEDAAYVTKRKSNLFGSGFAGEGKVTFGCSAKGKIWSLQSASDFNEWIEWCHTVGSMLTDESIKTDAFVRNLVKQETISTRPEKPPVAVHWPENLLIAIEDHIQFRFGANDWVGFLDCEIDLSNHNETGPIRFTISNGDDTATFEVRLSKDGAEYPQVEGPSLDVKFKGERTFTEYLSDDPPHIHFADGDFLIYNELFKLPTGADRALFDTNKIETRDWSNIDLTVESQGTERNPRSIQRAMIEELLAADLPYDIIFDDDGPGEVADIIAVRRDNDDLHVDLFHLKYSKSDQPGNRVADLYEVCGQAQKSVRWREYPARVFRAMRKREKQRVERGNPSRFEVGNLDAVRSFLKDWRELRPVYRIWIVQPGLSKSGIEPKQLDLLAATETFLSETYGIPLHVIASD